MLAACSRINHVTFALAVSLLKTQIHYRKYKGRKNGTCNICGELGPLTWDHIPPKGGIELLPVEIDRVVSLFVPSLGSSRNEMSNDGLKYRTICRKCNSHLSQYDVALNEFAIAVGRFLKSNLSFPSVIHIKAHPVAIARSVLGHLLAARWSPENFFFDDLIRGFIQEPDKPIPNEINVFYWLYPYPLQVVLRDAMMPLKRGNFTGYQRFGLLKYFPVAYLVTDVKEYEGLNSLTLWRKEPLNTSVELPVNLKSIRCAEWPERPEDGPSSSHLFVGGDGFESLIARPSKSIRRGQTRPKKDER